MARCEVVQVQCDRCRRIELRAPTPGAGTNPPVLKLVFEKTELIYQDLCEGCHEVVANLVKDIRQWQREIKAKLGPTVHSNQAPPLQVAPVFSPPIPHSAAGGKR